MFLGFIRRWNIRRKLELLNRDDWRIRDKCTDWLRTHLSDRDTWAFPFLISAKRNIWICFIFRRFADTGFTFLTDVFENGSKEEQTNAACYLASFAELGELEEPVIRHLVHTAVTEDHTWRYSVREALEKITKSGIDYEDNRAKVRKAMYMRAS